ncbi:hypothetical protein [Methylobacterium sp. NFXW15]|uniref:hypothetical protein n=1 Tax=Methylobacterium sp. NFXW15 TaxID=2819512 RepID=UPI003CF31E4C
MMDRETAEQVEALTLRLIRLADVRHDAGDHEGEAVARSVAEALCDMLDLGWLQDRRAQA